MNDREGYERVMAATIAEIGHGLKRRREVLRLERAFGSNEREACAAAARAFMLHLHETYKKSPDAA